MFSFFKFWDSTSMKKQKASCERRKYYVFVLISNNHLLSDTCCGGSNHFERKYKLNLSDCIRIQREWADVQIRDLLIGGSILNLYILF